MSSALTTSLLLPVFDPQPYVAEVLGADSTATTYLLNCAPGTDSNNCGTYNESITLGPWASQTLPPGAAETGLFDLHVSLPSDEDPWEFSVHCEMSRTVPQVCTTINEGGNNDGTPTATLSTGLADAGLASFTHVPVVITAGLELLTAAPTGPAPSAPSNSTASTDKPSGAVSSNFSSLFTTLLVAGVSAAVLLH